MEPIKTNLEPIEEKELNLEEKPRSAEGAAIEKQLHAVEAEKPNERVGAEKDDAYQNVLSKIQLDDVNHEEVASDAKEVHALDSASHVQQLVDIAMQKGVVHAVKVARHLDDNYALDAFHDQLLSDQLNAALKEKGLIEEL